MIRTKEILITILNGFYGEMKFPKGSSQHVIEREWVDAFEKYSPESLESAAKEYIRTDEYGRYPTIAKLLALLTKGDLEPTYARNENDGRPIDYRKALELSARWYNDNVIGWKETYKKGISSIYDFGLTNLLKGCMEELARTCLHDFRKVYSYAHNRDGDIEFKSQLALAWMTGWLPNKFDEFIEHESHKVELIRNTLQPTHGFKTIRLQNILN